jgi:hypothetical protein
MDGLRSLGSSSRFGLCEWFLSLHIPFVHVIFLAVPLCCASVKVVFCVVGGVCWVPVQP